MTALPAPEAAETEAAWAFGDAQAPALEGTYVVGKGKNQVSWFKAERSTSLNACVELARDGDVVLLRDSKDPSVTLTFTQLEINVFFEAVGKGEFSHLLQAGPSAFIG